MIWSSRTVLSVIGFGDVLPSGRSYLSQGTLCLSPQPIQVAPLGQVQVRRMGQFWTQITASEFGAPVRRCPLPSSTLHCNSKIMMTQRSAHQALLRLLYCTNAKEKFLCYGKVMPYNRKWVPSFQGSLELLVTPEKNCNKLTGLWKPTQPTDECLPL